jgi:hypothetical protein
VLLVALALVGCAGVPRAPGGSGVPAAPELHHVPFFPQARWQCGPAALATVLQASGIPVEPEDLAPRVYLPGRRGSLQDELVAATRQAARLPYVLDPSLEAIAREIGAGRPVLVLQNLGLKAWPRWHYAVVVGVTESHVVLRSGKQARRLERHDRFLRSWDLGDRWALVALRPGELPETPDVSRWLAANAAVATVGQEALAEANYAAGLSAWPDEPLLWFAAGNRAWREGDRAGAERAWRRTLALDPVNASARNNLAHALGERGCIAQAREHLGAARASAEPRLLAVLESTERALAERAAAAIEPPECAGPALN